MAALNKLQANISIRLHAAAQVDSEGRATYSADIAQQIAFFTGTGVDIDDCDMLYTDTLEFSASQAAADALDLRALVQAGNTMVMVRPKVIVLSYVEGEGTAFFDRGASNGYTGISTDGHSVSKNQPLTVLNPTVSTGAADKTIATSETAAATVTVKIAILGSSA